MVLIILDMYNRSKQFLLERTNHLYNVYKNTPEGDIKDKYWVETREWDKDSK